MLLKQTRFCLVGSYGLQDTAPARRLPQVSARLEGIAAVKRHALAELGRRKPHPVPEAPILA